MVWIGYSFPCGWSSPWLMVSQGLVCLGPQWSANICKVCWGRVELQSRGHSALKITCVFFFFFFLDMLIQLTTSSDLPFRGPHLRWSDLFFDSDFFFLTVWKSSKMIWKMRQQWDSNPRPIVMSQATKPLDQQGMSCQKPSFNSLITFTE